MSQYFAFSSCFLSFTANYTTARVSHVTASPTWSQIMYRSAVLLRLYSSQAAVRKSPLAVLRGKTGFPIVKCKEALVQHDNDLQLAEKWLYGQAEKEGWSKVEKLKGRAANQGLIGVLVRGNNAAMAEVCVSQGIIQYRACDADTPCIGEKQLCYDYASFFLAVML